MVDNLFLKQLSDFYHAARHLWGRCPRCGDLFRLSDAAISYGSEPPRDWLRRLQREQDSLAVRQGDLEQQQAEIGQRDYELQSRERDLSQRVRGIEREVRDRARDLVKNKDEMRGLMKEARQQAVRRSRSTLLGHFFERLAPFLQRFGHDPRDIRPLMNPIDYVCFDGLTIDRHVERVVFVEVKTGTSRPSAVQKSIEHAIRAGRVGTEVWQFGDKGIPIGQQLLSSSPNGRKVLPSE